MIPYKMSQFSKYEYQYEMQEFANLQKNWRPSRYISNLSPKNFKEDNRKFLLEKEKSRRQWLWTDMQIYHFRFHVPMDGTISNHGDVAVNGAKFSCQPMLLTTKWTRKWDLAMKSSFLILVTRKPALSISTPPPPLVQPIITVSLLLLHISVVTVLEFHSVADEIQ